MASEGTYRNCGSPRRLPRAEHSGNQEFGPLTPPNGERRRIRRILCVAMRSGLKLTTYTHISCYSSSLFNYIEHVSITHWHITFVHLNFPPLFLFIGIHGGGKAFFHIAGVTPGE